MKLNRNDWTYPKGMEALRRPQLLKARLEGLAKLDVCFRKREAAAESAFIRMLAYYFQR